MNTSDKFIFPFLLGLGAEELDLVAGGLPRAEAAKVFCCADEFVLECAVCGALVLFAPERLLVKFYLPSFDDMDTFLGLSSVLRATCDLRAPTRFWPLSPGTEAPALRLPCRS